MYVRSLFLFCLICMQLVLFCHGASISKVSGCQFSINTDLKEPQPLILLQNNATHHLDAFPLPIDLKGTVVLSSGQRVDLACPGGNSVIVDGSDSKRTLVEAECRSMSSFYVEGKVVNLNRVWCKGPLQHTARYTKKKCAGDYREIEIGYNVNKRFVQHLLTCYDSTNQNVLYTRANMSRSIGGFQFGYPRPKFLASNFYNVSPSTVDSLYSRTGQRATINKILGLSPSDTSVVQDNDYYLSRGHYSAKSDFVYGSQQNLTFYYVNTAPQWQTFNGGNWNTMEGDCRKFSSNRSLDLHIYTGSYGIATLPDVNTVQRKLYLWTGPGENTGIPVPAIFFRVVYDPANRAGVAFVGLNNPYKTNVQEDVLCRDICDQINWVTWKNNDIKLGFSYCCDVDELRETVTFIPKLDIRSLLK